MFKEIVKAIQNGRSPLLFTQIEGENAGCVAVQDGNTVIGDPAVVRDISACASLPCISGGVFCERITTPPHLILCGAGHVSVYTARIAKMVGFRVTVIDDRETFANRERFPDADCILNMPFPETLASIRDANAYYVIVTRGHQDDRTCLELILQKSYTYLGMIGSRTKIAHVFEHLRTLGFSDAQLSGVHAPIGLAIGAQTPEEIGVCIVGEMIEVKNDTARGSEWDAALCDAILNANERYAMVLLIDKKGSAPRSPGARMIVFPDGRIISSVGGGYGEFEAAERAKAMLRDGPDTMRYTCYMNNRDAAESGMICGGTIDVLIRIVEV